MDKNMTTGKHPVNPSVLLALALSLTVVLTAGCRTASPPAAPSPAVGSWVRTAPVAMVDFPRTLDVTGSIAPEYQAEIATRTLGRVDAVLVKEGDFVRRGQPILTLDARDLDAAVAEAQANVSAARTQVRGAQAALSMELAASPARVSEASAKVAEATAALQSAQAGRDLVMAGPRRQERLRSAQAVAQAAASLVLAQNTFDRMKRLYDQQAISGQDFDQAKSACDIARAQYQSALLGQSQVDEGSRSEEKRTADDAVEQAQASVLQARADLEQAEADTIAVDMKRSDVDRADSGLEQARAALALALANRSYATITAPFDGVIAARMVDPGAMSGPGVPLLKIEGGALRLEANVPESSLAVARIGSAVPVIVDAIGIQPILGTIVSVARQGDSDSHTFLIKIELPEGLPARSGMYGKAELSLGSNRFPAVPNSAVVARDGLTYLYAVDNDGVARLRFVTTGSERGGIVPILSGAHPGDMVVIAGTGSVRDGEHVDQRA
ncbi:MAG: efflux RND transporter periplasmic adaptor subunit [Capsulimonadaceae bacterium]